MLDAAPELDICEAAAVGADERVQQLLGEDAGAAARRSPDGFTPLHLASFFGHEQAARLLVAGGADVNVRAENANRVAPLHSAAAGGHTAIAELLLDAGAAPDETQEGGFTPLHSAAHNGDLRLVERLLQDGADPRRATDDGRTAVDLAAEAGHEEVLDRLRAE